MSLLLLLRSGGTPPTGPAPPGGKQILRDAKVVIAGVDVSQFCTTVAVQSERDEIDVTPISATYRQFIAGPATASSQIPALYAPPVFTTAFWAALDAAPTIQVTPRGSYATSAQN